MQRGATRKLALWVIGRLRQEGFEALLAGGCVRDILLGSRPTDYDVATNATPRQVRKLFKRVLMIGAKFGVAMVVQDGRTIEVATFRSDHSYSDGRRPDKVVFSSARADALRRDFTINGMFMDPVDEKIIDYVGGRTDLNKKIVRAIGEPDRRLGEDYLRMLRAIRFCARLDFALEPATTRAIRRHAPKICRISGERVREELEKMLSGPNSHHAMVLTGRLGLGRHIFGPTVTTPSAWDAALGRLALLGRHRDVTLSLAGILAAASAGHIRRLARSWGASNKMIGNLTWLTGHVDAYSTAADAPLGDFKRLIAHPAWPLLRKLWRAEEMRATGRDSAFRRAAVRTGRIDPAQISPPPLVTGKDLKNMGLDEGPTLGRILHTLYELQLAEETGTRRQALAEARRLVARAPQHNS